MTDRPVIPAGVAPVDIVVAAVVAVAFGVVFLAWNALCTATTPAFAAVPAAQAILYGVWLLPGVLVAAHRPQARAALFGELVSAAVSAFLGAQWGLDALLSGLIQGAGAEVAFALFLYRAWTLPIAMLGGGLAGIGGRDPRHRRLLPRRRDRLQARLRRRRGVRAAWRSPASGRGCCSAALVRTGVLRRIRSGTRQRRHLTTIGLL